MTRVQAADRYPIVVAASAAVVLAVLFLLLCGAPLYTDDTWWHLKAGEMYAAEGLWPAADWMLHTAHARGPVQHEWLFGWLLHHVQSLVGFQGLRAFHAFAAAAIICIAFSIFRRASTSTVAALAAWSVFVLLAWFRLFQLRPDLISIIATLLLYCLVLEADRVPSWSRVAGCVAVLVVWANFHSLFLVGVNLIVAALLGVILSELLRRYVVRSAPGNPEVVCLQRRRAIRLGVALVAGLIATLLNPQGVDQHLIFFTSTESTALWHIADEWSHFNPFDPAANHAAVGFAHWLSVDILLVLFFIVSSVRLWGVFKHRSWASVQAFQPIAFGLALASVVALLTSIRFTWMGLFLLLYLLRAVAWDTATVAASARRGLSWLLATVSLSICASFATESEFANLANRFRAQPSAYLSTAYRTHKYHVEGVSFLRHANLEGNLFNTYYMGGFLGYWLAPRLRTFVDGRTGDYDSSVYLDYSGVTEMLGAKPGESFLDILDRHEVDLFFGIGFPGWWQGAATTNHLDNVDGWILVSRSYRHAIFLRRNARNQKNIERVASYYASQGLPFDPLSGLDPNAIISRDPQWAIGHAMLPMDYLGLLEQAHSGPENARSVAANEIGVSYLMTGAYELQIDWDRQIAQRSSNHEFSRRRLIYTLLKLGRIAAARDVSQQLLALNPNDRRSLLFAQMVQRFEQLQALRNAPEARKAVQIASNRLLRQLTPATATADETWPIEYRMLTEHPVE